VRAISALPLSADAHDVLVMIVPLFVAGLFMLPFLIPTFDRMARRDLEAHRQRTGAPGSTSDVTDAPPGPDPE
jgi:hypothetical protein